MHVFEERVTSEINQREVWVKGEEHLQTAAEVWGADLFFKRFRVAEGGIYFYLLRFTCPKAMHTRTERVSTGQLALIPYRRLYQYDLILHEGGRVERESVPRPCFNSHRLILTNKYCTQVTNLQPVFKKQNRIKSFPNPF